MHKPASRTLILVTQILWALFVGDCSFAQQKATLEVRTTDGRSTFQMGERVPLELRFAAPKEANLTLNMATYDRSGRMSYEQFEVSPGDGWSDPLGPYFSTNMGTFGGGLTFFQDLSSQPQTISITLNEWVRFDQPGTYQVIVTSRRAARKNAGLSEEASEPLQARPVVLHILPANPAWQAAKLQAILSELKAVPPSEGIPDPRRRQAIADLRYLGSKAAIQALAANLREDRPDFLHDSAFGLMGVAGPMRDAAIRAMEQRINDPEFPVCSWFLEAMAVLASRASASGDPDQEGRIQAQDVLWHGVLSALSRKRGSARAKTAQMLLGTTPSNLDSVAQAELVRTLASSLLDLSEDQQASELNSHWDLLRSEDLLPALQLSARLPLENPGSNESHAYARRGLKSVALARWYELDPAGATQEILAQLGSSHPSLTAPALAFLPRMTLPQFESMWAQRFAETDDYEEEAVLAGLLVRFGTGAATPVMAAKLKAKLGNWAIEAQAATLAYLVKFDPEQARFLLKQLLATSCPAARCSPSYFQSIARYASGPVLNDAAVSALNNSNENVVMDALIYLADHGRKEDEKPIRKRYEQWTEQWAGKENFLDSQEPASLEGNYRQIGLGQNLAHALIANQGWLADKDLIQQVVALCVGKEVCRQTRDLAAEAGPPYHVSVSRGSNYESYNVAQYSAKSMDLLEEKIKQFPAGTVFNLIPVSPKNGDQRKLEQGAEVLFRRNGMTLQPAPD